MSVFASAPWKALKRAEVEEEMDAADAQHAASLSEGDVAELIHAVETDPEGRGPASHDLLVVLLLPSLMHNWSQHDAYRAPLDFQRTEERGEPQPSVEVVT